MDISRMHEAINLLLDDPNSESIEEMITTWRTFCEQLASDTNQANGVMSKLMRQVKNDCPLGISAIESECADARTHMKLYQQPFKISEVKHERGK